MTAPRYTRLVTALLAHESDEGRPTPAPSVEARAAAVKAIEAAIAGRARARRRLRALSVLGALAATVAIGVGVFAAVRSSTSSQVAEATVSHPADGAAILHPQGDVVIVGSDGQPEDGTALGSGNRLVVRPQGRAMLAFATGTELVLEERGDLTLVDQGAQQRFALSGGSLRAKVAKLAPGRRFTVATGDAEIEVRGTQFRVSVVEPDPSCGGGTTTRVDVTEGQVVVRQGGAEARVNAGEHWPSGCGPTASLAPAASAPVTVAAVDVRKVPSPPPVRTVEAPPVPTSQLADQNNMFASALAAKRSGNVGGAVAGFDRFLAAYPASPLAESAMAERMKVLRTRASAQQYLARYPNGFARSDAQAILASHP